MFPSVTMASSQTHPLFIAKEKKKRFREVDELPQVAILKNLQHLNKRTQLPVVEPGIGLAKPGCPVHRLGASLALSVLLTSRAKVIRPALSDSHVDGICGLHQSY